jgi:hypothetical protein
MSKKSARKKALREKNKKRKVEQREKRKVELNASPASRDFKETGRMKLPSPVSILDPTHQISMIGSVGNLKLTTWKGVSFDYSTEKAKISNPQMSPETAQGFQIFPDLSPDTNIVMEGVLQDGLVRVRWSLLNIALREMRFKEGVKNPSPLISNYFNKIEKALDLEPQDILENPEWPAWLAFPWSFMGVNPPTKWNWHLYQYYIGVWAYLVFARNTTLEELLELKEVYNLDQANVGLTRVPVALTEKGSEQEWSLNLYVYLERALHEGFTQALSSWLALDLDKMRLRAPNFTLDELLGATLAAYERWLEEVNIPINPYGMKDHLETAARKNPILDIEHVIKEGSAFISGAEGYEEDAKTLDRLGSWFLCEHLGDLDRWGVYKKLPDGTDLPEQAEILNPKWILNSVDFDVLGVLDHALNAKKGVENPYNFGIAEMVALVRSTRGDLADIKECGAITMGPVRALPMLGLRGTETLEKESGSRNILEFAARNTLCMAFMLKHCIQYDLIKHIQGYRDWNKDNSAKEITKATAAAARGYQDVLGVRIETTIARGVLNDADKIPVPDQKIRHQYKALLQKKMGAFSEGMLWEHKSLRKTSPNPNWAGFERFIFERFKLDPKNQIEDYDWEGFASSPVELVAQEVHLKGVKEYHKLSREFDKWQRSLMDDWAKQKADYVLRLIFRFATRVLDDGRIALGTVGLEDAFTPIWFLATFCECENFHEAETPKELRFKLKPEHHHIIDSDSELDKFEQDHLSAENFEIGTQSRTDNTLDSLAHLNNNEIYHYSFFDAKKKYTDLKKLIEGGDLKSKSSQLASVTLMPKEKGYILIQASEVREGLKNFGDESLEQVPVKQLSAYYLEILIEDVSLKGAGYEHIFKKIKIALPDSLEMCMNADEKRPLRDNHFISQYGGFVLEQGQISDKACPIESKYSHIIPQYMDYSEITFEDAKEPVNRPPSKGGLVRTEKEEFDEIEYRILRTLRRKRLPNPNAGKGKHAHHARPHEHVRTGCWVALKNPDQLGRDQNGKLTQRGRYWRKGVVVNKGHEGGGTRSKKIVYVKEKLPTDSSDQTDEETQKDLRDEGGT